MNGFNEKDGILHADNVPLPQIAEAVGTPCYVYAESVIREQYERLAGAMTKALPSDRQPLLCYACKANSNIAVLSFLRSLGCGLEIVSEGELMRGLKAGFDADKIVSTGVGKQKNEIAACLDAGIHQFNVESLPELEMINTAATETGKTANVVFRLNPDVSGGGHDKISTGRKRDKFGMGVENVMKAFAMARDMDHVNALGLSMHIGSQVFTVESFKEAFEKLPALVHGLRESGHTISRLDIGGGFPIIYKDEKLLDLDSYADWVRDIILPLDTEIIMEPGRYLVGGSGVLLTEVLYVKETQDRSFLVVDAAMSDLIRPTLYEAWHSIDAVKNRSASPQTYDVVGPICESSDIFATQRSLPEMNQGDLAAIRTAGAYGFSMASTYNSRPLPAEVLVSGDKFSIIRKRQALEGVMDGETIPDWLK
ncbi:MAG: diaminopimelate decarboxylase [Micavibrio sp.]|nr:MAG: diaminopimelate decarboxylase [Micavibrio sp.]